jgi:NAD(P)-dependent dehydrogenase (short-subunit alcohol dehydrogenase family)
MRPESLWVEDSVVVVTGGAGQLGSALCERFDELGNTVVMADVNIEGCHDQIERRELVHTHALELDITDPASVRTGFEGIVEKYGSIDVLVNNAGIAVFTPFEERTFEEFDDVMKVNVYGTFFCTQAAQKYMAESNGGSIVNIGSIYGVESPDPGIYGDSGINSSEVYGASKAAVIQMTKYMAVHLADDDIRVNCVSPGGIFADQAETFLENYRAKVPAGRMAREDDLVDVVVFLSADASRYITGQNLVVDGGFTAW